MAQHFLLTAAARTLSLKAIFRMSDAEAHAAFTAIRFSQNKGEAFCPRCGCCAVYTYAARRIWKCQACHHKFSVTSGTIFASRKLVIRDYLAAIAIFVSAVKGISALQLGRDLDVQYKTAFVLAHKLREAIGAQQMQGTLSGVVEVDGCYIGGAVKQENKKEDRKDRRLLEQQNGKRQSVVVARERGGKTLPFVFGREADAVATLRQWIATGSIVHVDEAGGWDALHAHFEMRQINHSVAFSLGGPARTRLRATSVACGAPRWGSTIVSRASICSATRLRWRGGRVPAASPTRHCMCPLRERRWGIRFHEFGRDIGSVIGCHGFQSGPYSRSVLISSPN